MAGGNVVGPYVGRITRVPGAYIQQGVDVFARIAERNGGSMMGSRLTVRVEGQAISDDSGAATIVGTPAGAWAMAESGAKPHAITPDAGSALAGGLSHPVSVPVRHPGFAGEERWSHTVEQANVELARLAQTLADQAAG
jgi:hypothetical protein